MKKLMIASVFALGLAACGGGGGGAKAALVKSCLDDGSSDETTCNCMADVAVDKLDPKLVGILVEATKAEDEDAFMMSKMGELSPEEMTSFMTVMMSAATECGMEM
jgi:basic membrane lipoprotein Med (substrate-binding protein (PBP1-ABC) superfamily)